MRGRGTGEWRRSKCGVLRRALVIICVGVWGAAGATLGTEQTLYPSADGTLVDGAPYGPFDGNADAWDWTFDQSSYEGSIALSNAVPGSNFEARVVWEYDLSPVASGPPVTARFQFTLRGAPRFPADPAPVCVFAYPADLLEKPEDFKAAPIGLLAILPIDPYQLPTPYTLDVGTLINQTLQQGVKRMGFRFQICPNGLPGATQAFLDALDSDKATQPQLIIDTAIPGDADGDGDVDRVDFALFTSCMTGPGGTATPACRVFDFDLDADVDLLDLQAFLYYYTLFGH